MPTDPHDVLERAEAIRRRVEARNQQIAVAKARYEEAVEKLKQLGVDINSPEDVKRFIQKLDAQIAAEASRISALLDELEEELK